MHLTAFGEEGERLRSFYPNERPCLDDPSIWYSDGLIRLDTSSHRAACPVETVRPRGWGEAAPYWVPHKDLHQHMRTVAAGSHERLVRPSPENGKAVNANFHAFPVRYGLQDLSLGEFEIDDTIRVRSLSDGIMEIERANYLDQLATNIHPDLTPAGWTNTLRQIEIENGRLRAFSADSNFANTIGSCAILIDKEGIPLLRFRGRPETLQSPDLPSSRMAVMEKGWHCVASGVTKWQDLCWEEPERASCSFVWLVRGVTRGMWRELLEETALTSRDGLTITTLAFARELKRAGKPNFFFVIEAKDKTCAELEELILARNPPDKDEYTTDSYSIRSLFGIVLGGKPVSFMADENLRLDKLSARGFSGRTTGFTYENYAALRFAAEWWRTTQTGSGRKPWRTN